MYHTRKNMVEFYSKLEEFWTTEKYTDVILECEDRSFKCHRLVLASSCSYFDAMFGGKFRESTEENVVLHDISATALEEVVRFIYTGDATITSANIYSLVQATEFFRLAEFEDMCVQFIGRNQVPIESIFNIFAFACATEKTRLIDMLSTRIAQQFSIFSDTTRFLDISFHELKIVLNQCASLSVKSDESCLRAIGRWVFHNREERSRYSHELVKMITFENVSPSYVKYMFTRFYADSDFTVLTERIRPLQTSTVLMPEVSLHIFVKHKEEKIVRIFSINSIRDCFFSGEQISVTHPHHWVRTASNNSYFYTFEHSLEDSDKFNPTFSAYTSINLSSKLELKPPPFILNEVSMCCVQNNVYMYNEFCLNPPLVRKDLSNSQIFNEDEISRGVYVYNCEVDNWFPVPRMKRQLIESCMIGCNNILYLFGGSDFNHYYRSTGYVQAYDYRSGEWQELQNSSFQHSAAACCAIGNSIYVCGGQEDPIQAARYDVIAGKWESIPKMNKGMKFHRVMSFSDHLWAMNRFHLGRDHCYDLSIEMYDPKSKKWNSSSILLEATGKIANIDTSNFVEAVVF